MKLNSTVALLTLALGCTPVVQSRPVVTAVPETDAGAATGLKLDTATVRPDNPGYVMDVNDDGTADFIQLVGNTVYFKNRNAGGLSPILTIKAEIVAYSITSDGIYFWDSKHDGFFQRKLGVSAGVPFYGNAEQR